MSIDELREHIAQVVAYNWKDELSDFEDQTEPAARENHIFRHLVALDGFLGGHDFTPESFIKPNSPAAEAMAH